MGEMRNAYRMLVGKPEGKRSLERPRCRWKIILDWILGKQDGKLCTGFICLGIGTMNMVMNLWGP
jgi:hypothetical protein